VAELVGAGRATELRGIGRGIDARLRELVETGEIAELAELEREAAPKLKAAVERARRRGRGRSLLLNRSRPLLTSIADGLGGEVAGDVRRWRDAAEHLAVVVAAAEPEGAIDAFAALPEIVTVLERTGSGATGVTVEGVPIELAVAEPARFGTELLRATGSPAYVEALGPLPDAPDEEGVYRLLGLPWCPPELREAPFRGEPPPLLELEDIRGDLHCHTTWSDGRASVCEMGEAARALGYEYLAICDHTTAVRVVPGLDADAVRRQGEEVAAANEALAPFRILRGIECDILPDGALDLPDDVLAELDWVQASVHAGQRQEREALTERVLEALRNPHVSALSHPTGRLINHRPPNAVDLERVFEVAVETGTAVEVNGLPDRLDLKGEHVRLALEAGVRIVVSTDAHSMRGLGNMELAVHTARRGGATAADVVNTRSLADLVC
jgi:DNA polymerase (family 10)